MSSVASGCIGGLSYAVFESVRLEILAWVWMVPMLLTSSRIASFRTFFAHTYATMLVLFATGTWWVAYASVAGAIGTFLLGALVFTMPLIAVYPLRRMAGWRTSMMALPFVWTALEWLYLQTEASIAWFQLSINQAPFTRLIQYAELTGPHGVTFWLVLTNVAMAWIILSSRRSAETRPRLFTRAAGTAALLLLPPLAYSSFAIKRYEKSLIVSRSVRALAVQTAVPPEVKWERAALGDVIERVVATTDRAMLGGALPDVIVWPEQSIPATLGGEIRDFVHTAVLDWKRPVVVGAPEAVPRPGQSKGVGYSGRIAMFLLSPEPGGRSIATATPYYKRRLLPFAERVPFVESMPWLQRFGLGLARRIQWEPGVDGTLFALPLRDGQTARAGVQICYEQIYPDSVAEVVRSGAELLVFPSNDAWYGRTPGARVIARAARLRAIETRRSIVRSANAGVTHFVDPLGRVEGELATWVEASSEREVPLVSVLTPFVRSPGWFPWTCLLISATVFMGAAVGSFRSRQPQERLLQ